MRSPELYINGKFLGSPVTAVHRVAHELVRELGLLVAQPSYSGPGMEIICPRETAASQLPGIAVRNAGISRSQLWEQVDLPHIGRDGVILSLCNLAPMLARRAITLIHDAQVFSTPQSYSKPFGLWYRNVHRINGRRHAIATVSRFSAQELARFGIADVNRIHVIHNGVDHVLRASPDAAILARHNLSDHRYVVALANVQKHKNIGLLAKAFASDRLHCVEDLRLVLVGAATREDFRNAGIELPSNAVLVGKVSDGELRALLGRSLCVASPSVTEGFGLLPLEGMLLGAPAMISPSGAQPEVCGGAAIHASVSSPNDWSEKIGQLSQRPDERRMRGDAGRQHAAQFTWKRAAEMLLDVVIEELQRTKRVGVSLDNSPLHMNAAPREQA